MIINSFRFGQAYTARTTAFATATGITDATILGALNTFDLGLISNSLDTKMKAVYPFLGGTASTHKYNFMNAVDNNSAFRLVFSGGFTNSSTGILPNGTNAYANTFLNPSLVLNPVNHSFGSYSRTNNAVLSTYGNYDGVNILQHNFNGTMVSGDAGRNILSYTASPTTKFFVASRTNINLFEIYRDSTLLNTNTVTSNVNTVNNNFYLFARNFIGTPNLYSVHELSFAFIGDGLNSTEVTNFTNLVNALQTSLSRNV